MVGKKNGLLLKYYGYSEFRPFQEKIIDSIISGRDTLAIMPTGAGKSLCYQISALLLPGITLVISPLISLMKDQVDDLCQRGINAACINSSLERSEYIATMNAAAHGFFKILYIAPERLDTAGFVRMVSGLNVSQVAVDEAHCVSQWGHDFRPGYAAISSAVASLPGKPVVSAFTATATRMVRKDVVRLLKLREPAIYITGLDRPNLSFSCSCFYSAREKREKLLQYVQNRRGCCGLIYAATRREADEIYDELLKERYSVGKYHAGLPDEERKQVQERFVNGQLSIIVATNAFGMGIDKPDIRFVLHNNMPKNIEAYYQEAGRAGRDGEPSECVLYYCDNDAAVQRYFIEDGECDQIRKTEEYRSLNEMVNYCRTTDCLRKTMLNYLGDEHPGSCGNCSNCAGEFTLTDYSGYARLVLGCILKIERAAGFGFGKTVIAEILKGSKTVNISRYGFDKLDCYGKMRKNTLTEIKAIIDRLVAEKLLEYTTGKYPLLIVTKKGSSCLAQNQSLLIREKNSGVSGTSTGKPLQSADVGDTRLFELLRELRRKLAARDKVPPYIVFSDKTLADMSRKMPDSENDLLKVHGVGELKCQRYGSWFLKEIARFRNSNR